MGEDAEFGRRGAESCDALKIAATAFSSNNPVFEQLCHILHHLISFYPDCCINQWRLFQIRHHSTAFAWRHTPWRSPFLERHPRMAKTFLITGVSSGLRSGAGPKRHCATAIPSSAPCARKATGQISKGFGRGAPRGNPRRLPTPIRSLPAIAAIEKRYRRDRRAGEQCRLWPRRHSGGILDRGSAAAIRGSTCLARVAMIQGRAARDAPAPRRAYSQYHLDGRHHHPCPALSYYHGKQVRAGRNLRGARQGGEGFRHPRHGGRARRLSGQIGPDARWCARRGSIADLRRVDRADPQNVAWSSAAGRSATPAKAAQAMLKVALSDNPPAHLLLGSDAVRLVDEKDEIAASGLSMPGRTSSLSTDVA